MLDLRSLKIERRLLRLGSKLLILERQFRNLLHGHHGLGVLYNGGVEVDSASFALFLATLPLLGAVHVKRRFYLTS